MRDNAVVIKELRSRMRGGRASLILTLYLIVLSTFAFGVIDMTEQTMSMGARPFYIGAILLLAISFFQLAMVLFLTPAFTVGAITREKEQQTHDLLVITKMSPLSIVIGKLFSAVAYIFLLILASLPVTSIVFIFGGVSLLDFVLVYLFTLVTTIFFGAIGLFFSSLVRKTQFSTILSYSVVLTFVIGTLITSVFIGVFFLQGPNADRETGALLMNMVLIFNPFYSLGSIFSSMVPGPFSIPTIVGGPDGQQGAHLIADWLYTLIVYSILTVLLILASAQLIKPINRWSFKFILRRSGKENAQLDKSMIVSQSGE
ncbi:MAG: ABC transporter permease [Actinomycetota bacterium]|nr:ABC transporter permease [Actinomycetota bacterium]